MPEDKIAAVTTESVPAETTTPTTQEQIVADAIADRSRKGFGSPDDDIKETVEAAPAKAEEETESVETESEPAADETTEEPVEKTPVEDDDATAHVKRSMQKRIDKLTAEKKSLEDRVAKIETKVDKPEDKKEPVYTREQLKAATKKFMDEGDSDGMFEVMEHMAKVKTKELEERYIGEQNRIREETNKNKAEWQSVERHYSNDEDPALDIRKSNSLLFKVAKQFYEDPEIGPMYLQPGGGGMLQAVADALAEILRYRADKGIKDKVPIIKAKEAKDRRKLAMGGVGSMRPEDTAPKSSGSELEAYMAERKAALAKSKGVKWE